MKINWNYVAIAVILIIGLLYFNVTVNSPIIFGDEGYWASSARLVSEKGIFPEYEEFHSTEVYHKKFTKAPLFIIFEVLPFMLLGEFGIKLLIPIFTIFSAFMLYFIFKDMGKKKAGIAAAASLMLIPGIVTYGVLNYAETSMLFMFLASIFFATKYVKDNKLIYQLLSGIFAAFAALTDVTGIFILGVILAYFIVSKVKLKQIIIFLLIFGIFISPLFIKNFVLFNAVCYKPININCDPVEDIPLPENIMNFEGWRAPEQGTEQSLFKLGILPYTRFAFGWMVPILAIFGFVFSLHDRKKMDIMMLVLFLFFFILTFSYESVWMRAENTVRYTFPMLISIAYFVGLASQHIYDYTKKYNIIFAILVVLLLSYGVFFYGNEKITGMHSVKQFSPGFFDACDWVDVNTPSDSLIYNTYSHHTTYHCNRASIAGPNRANIQLTNNDTSYENLKFHGFDYIMVPIFLIQTQPYSEYFSIDFVQYIESSENFERVFDNTPTYGNTGVIIYKIV